MINTAKNLTDQQLFSRTDAAASADRINTAELLVCLGEIDARGTYRQRACSSMWVYCTERLRMSADVASVRLRAARVVRRYPRLLDDIAAGHHHVSGLSLLFKVMGAADFPRMLEEARGKSKRDIEAIVARTTGPIRVRDTIKALGVAPRRMQAPGEAKRGEAKRGEAMRGDGKGGEPGGQAGLFDAGSAVPSVGEHAGRLVEEQSFRVAFTASARTNRKLREARDLLRHSLPNGALDEVFYRALTLLVDDVKRKKLGQLKQRGSGSDEWGGEVRGGRAAARSSTRPGPSDPGAISRATKREVSERDGHRCTYTDGSGNRCGATSWLEFDHIVPRALGGLGGADNVRLLCRAHNQLSAEEQLGVAFVRSKRRGRPPSAAHGVVQWGQVGQGA